MDSVDIEVLRTAEGWRKDGRKVALGTIVKTWGSAPRPTGAMVAVRDDGSGAPTGIVDGATGVGLRAVRQRLETRYGRASSFVVTTAPGDGFVVRATLPAHTPLETSAAPAPAAVPAR